MNITRLLGGASAVVHFAGIGLGKGRRADDGDDQDDKKDGKKGRAAEGDDEDDGDKKSGRADDGDDQDDKKDGKKGRAADGDDEGDDDDAKGKKSRRADGDEDDENCEDDDDKDEMHGRSAVANARRRERARCAAILGSTHAGGNVALAASLAFNTTMTRKEAIKVLQDTPPRGEDAADSRSDARRAGNPRIGAGSESRPTGAQAVTASWNAALEKAGVKPR